MAALKKGKLAQQPKWKGIVFNLMIFIGVLLIAAAIMSVIKVVHYATYQHPPTGIQIDFPTYWKLEERHEPGAIVAFVSPLEDSLDDRAEAVVLTYQVRDDLSMSMSQFSQTAVSQVAGTFQGNIKVLEKRSFDVGGRPGYKFVYAGRGKDVVRPIKYMHVWTFIDDKAFIITYVASEEKFEKYMKEVKHIIRSLGPLDPELTKKAAK